MSAPRYVITGGNRFHAQYRPSRRDHREVIQPMDSKPVRFANRNGFLLFAIIAATAAVVFNGPL